ncbi:MAG: 23S rRNA (adenine(2503)-C(2))-methyltransferase RlmN [Bacteroidales bacterium]
MSGNLLPDIRSLTKPELEEFFLLRGEKKFRAGQVYDWLWKKGCTSFEGMTSLSKTDREILSNHFSFRAALPDVRQVSSDGTVKTGFRLHDGLMVEGVLIPSGERSTICISSQVGCSLGCKFCATGQLGFTRNLSVGEIFDQVTGTQRGAAGISNLVFMGMGEPFLNYEHVTGAIAKITSAEGLGMSPQRITVSSVGIPKMIRRMADDAPKYHFALSLHAATDAKRDNLIPFNLKFPLADLTEALIYYHKKTEKRFTIEYILFGNFNDSVADAKDLAMFCRNFPVKINIIEYNPVKGTGFVRAEPARMKAFTDYLENKNLVVNVRQSRGKDIDAACGQLAGKSMSNE